MTRVLGEFVRAGENLEALSSIPGAASMASELEAEMQVWQQVIALRGSTRINSSLFSSLFI